MTEPRTPAERIFEVKRHGLPQAGETGYVKMWNEFLRSNLSPRGAKIMGYLLSQADGFKPNKKRMAEDMGVNGRTVAGGIDDAVTAGYLIKQDVIGRKGKVVNTVYHVSQTLFSDSERSALSTAIETDNPLTGVQNVQPEDVTGVQNVQSANAECAVTGVQNVQCIEEQEKTKEEPPTPKAEGATDYRARIEELKGRPWTQISEDEGRELRASGYRYLPDRDRWIRKPEVVAAPQTFTVPAWVSADLRAEAVVRNIPEWELGKIATMIGRDPKVNSKNAVLRSRILREEVRPEATPVSLGLYQGD